MENQIYKKGAFWERLFALIIDGIILWIVAVIFSVVLSGMSNEFRDLMFWIISILYGSIFVWKSGSTPGKKLLNLKVVNTDYQPVDFKTALLRESIGKLLSGLIFSLGYLWVLINSKKQAWHDKIAKTYVVKADTTDSLIPITQDEQISTGQKVLFGFLILIFGLPIPALTLFIIANLFIAQPFEIKGQGMAPNYVDGQYYLVSKLAYRLSEPTKGDVIVFKYPENPDVYFKNRIIATPGETVSLQNGKVYINGQVLDENSYLDSNTLTYGGAFLQEGQQIVVPVDSYFVLGDNRAHTSDSREWGFIPKQNIIGKMAFCYFRCSLPKDQ